MVDASQCLSWGKEVEQAVRVNFELKSLSAVSNYSLMCYAYTEETFLKCHAYGSESVPASNLQVSGGVKHFAYTYDLQNLR